MIVRLWWKEARQFWSIWAVLVLAAMGCQWLVLSLAGESARQGPLVAVAMGWVALYAFAVSSAAFAGERETETLLFLDMLPVSRISLWWGKTSFAVVTTAILAIMLGAVAWLGTDRLLVKGTVLDSMSGPDGLTATGAFCLTMLVGMLLLEILALGWLWSAFSSNALIAAVLAIVSMLFCVGLTWEPSFRIGGATPLDSSRFAAWGAQFAIALAATAVSGLVIMRNGRLWRASGTATSQTVPVGQLVRSQESERERTTHGSIAYHQIVALVWQTIREAWPVWWKLAAIEAALIVPLLILFGRFDTGMPIVLAGFLTIAAGVNVFGAETRRRSYRFLVNHAARPGLVWGVKLGVWGAWTTGLWIMITLLLMPSLGWPRDDEGVWRIIEFIAGICTIFAVGTVCGMTISRGITASVVAMLGVFAVGLPQGTLASRGMLPGIIPVLIPLVLFGITWAWSKDWMLERPGLSRWVRLGLLLFVSLGGVVATDIAIRAWGVGDSGQGFDRAAFLKAAEVDKSSNAAEEYEAIYKRMGQGFSKISLGPDSVLPKGYERQQEENAKRLEEIRLASKLPTARSSSLARLTLTNPTRGDISRLSMISELVIDSAEKRRAAGNLAGAWDDLMILFRMARQFSGKIDYIFAYNALATERRALGEALEWSVDAKQTPEQLHAALLEYRGLPAMPTISDTIRAEELIALNTLELPREDLAAFMNKGMEHAAPNPFEQTFQAVQLALMTSPWEIERARRAERQIYSLMVQEAELAPWERPLNAWPYRVIEPLLATTPIMRHLVFTSAGLLQTNDTNEVGRRALVQFLALRHFQLTHDGRFPQSLNQLVASGELPVVPVDPYTNGLFVYEKSKGQRVPSLKLFDSQNTGGVADSSQWINDTSDRWLLYSVGPDRVKGGAVAVGGDIVFALPKEK